MSVHCKECLCLAPSLPLRLPSQAHCHRQYSLTLSWVCCESVSQDNFLFVRSSRLHVRVHSIWQNVCWILCTKHNCILKQVFPVLWYVTIFFKAVCDPGKIKGVFALPLILLGDKYILPWLFYLPCVWSLLEVSV